MTGRIHSFETLGTLDGPGIRLVVFMAGCNLRCRYCHNPDSWEMKGQNEYSVEQILQRAERVRPYFGEDGGITVSGGEPLLQAGFVAELFKACRAKGIHTCLDTSSSVFNDKVKSVLVYTDLLLLDVKHTEKEKYYELTGGDMAVPVAFLDHCRTMGQKMWIRQVVIPGYTDSEAYMEGLLRYIKNGNVHRVELLPYHENGRYKWERLGMEYPFAGMPLPDMRKIEKLREKYNLK